MKKTAEKPRVLITGGCGFIGVNLVNYLLRKQFKSIRILDNLTTGTRENLEDALRKNGEIISERENRKTVYKFKDVLNANISSHTHIELITGDIRSNDVCLETTRDIDSVVHLAAHAGVIPSIKDPFFDFEVNVQGTLNLLSASVKNRVDKFIFASSNAPLGEQEPPLSEKKVPRPLSPYGASKLACEGYCSAFWGSYGLKTVSLRFSNAYGPYSHHKNSVIAKFIKDSLSKNQLTIYGDGHQTRDFIHVDDISQGIFLCLKARDSDTIWGKALHLGTGKEVSINELASRVKKLSKDDPRIAFEPGRKGEISRNYSEISLTKRLLGFQPEVSLDKGLQATFKWYKDSSR